jgi:phosphatidylglycerophosphate synthase
MDLYAYIYGSSDVKIWGLTSRERIEKILKQRRNINVVYNLELIPQKSSVLLINCRYIFDERILNALINNANTAISVRPGIDDIIAVNIAAHKPNQILKLIKKEIEITELKDINIKNVSEVTNTGFHKKLKKVEKPFILDTEKDDTSYIANKLYYGSYKGVTDIITRLIWPKPAMKAVKFCVDKNISPNQVTMISLMLAVLVGLFFYINQYFIGLVLAWFMTFLDTVDGKLARVTISSTKLGDRLDHGIDVLSPLYWYACWAYGLLNINDWDISIITLNQTVTLIFIFYIIGRLCEGSFQFILKVPFSIFCWKPFDSFFRLITARRNPNLIILTFSAVFGAYDVGLFIIALWTVISTVILIIRLSLAFGEKRIKGQLISWLTEIDPEIIKKRKIYKLFIY